MTSENEWDERHIAALAVAVAEAKAGARKIPHADVMA